ncbi:MAG: ATP-binding protein [Bacilli bacterium]|nr:ATP-binding protein [Bacilli bacterium]
MIYRHIAKIIDDATKHYPIILLSGPRQIGKSTLLYGSFLNKGYSYVSFDDSLELAMAKSDPATFLKLHKAPLIIDEVQKVPELFPELERIVNECRLKEGNAKANGLYILSGSQRQRLLEQSKESLSGRVAILDMTNLSLNEIFKRENIPFCVDISTITNRITDYTIDDLNVYKYIVRGFFPQLYEDMDMKHQLFYSSYLTTYLEKDLKDLISIYDEVKYINFLQILASNTGEELIYDNYAKHIGVSTNTIKNWISVLVKIGIIYLVEPYNEESIVKRVVKRPKMYFFDTGLACYLCGIDSEQTLKKSFLKGRFFETFIFNELRKSYINNGEVQNMFYYRDTHQNEVDFILIRNGTLSCIEIKTGQNFNVSDCKAFLQFANTKLNKGKNCIICTADKISMLNDGTLIIPISSI